MRLPRVRGQKGSGKRNTCWNETKWAAHIASVLNILPAVFPSQYPIVIAALSDSVVGAVRGKGLGEATEAESSCEQPGVALKVFKHLCNLHHDKH